MLCFSLSSFTSTEKDTLTTEKESIEVDNTAFAITLRYYNKDSKDYEFKVKTGDKITIKDGCIKID